MAEQMMRQYAPFPTELDVLVKSMGVTVHPQWRFWLGDRVRDPADTHSGEAGGLTLVITAYTPDAYHPEMLRGVDHLFGVPAATYDRPSWQRWILARLEDIHRHELCEALVFGVEPGPCNCGADNFPDHSPGCKSLQTLERPFAPNHGPGRDPYTIFIYSDDGQRRTSFRGKLNPV